MKSLGVSSAEWNVSRVAAPPSEGITNTSSFPNRSLANAIVFPSRLHTGVCSYAECTLSGIARPPSAGTM